MNDIKEVGEGCRRVSPPVAQYDKEQKRATLENSEYTNTSQITMVNIHSVSHVIYGTGPQYNVLAVWVCSPIPKSLALNIIIEEHQTSPNKVLRTASVIKHKDRKELAQLLSSRAHILCVWGSGSGASQINKVCFSSDTLSDFLLCCFISNCNLSQFPSSSENPLCWPKTLYNLASYISHGNQEMQWTGRIFSGPQTLLFSPGKTEALAGHNMPV